MRITAEQLKAGIDLLENFRKDYQLDRDSPGHVGFLNVGKELLDETQKGTFQVICDNSELFTPIMNAMGLFTEEPINEEETVFYLV